MDGRISKLIQKTLKPISDLYNTAGVDFSFSKESVEDTIQFITEEINKLNQKI